MQNRSCIAPDFKHVGVRSRHDQLKVIQMVEAAEIGTLPLAAPPGTLRIAAGPAGIVWHDPAPSGGPRNLGRGTMEVHRLHGAAGRPVAPDRSLRRAPTDRRKRPGIVPDELDHGHDDATDRSANAKSSPTTRKLVATSVPRRSLVRHCAGHRRAHLALCRRRQTATNDAGRARRLQPGGTTGSAKQLNDTFDHCRSDWSPSGAFAPPSRGKGRGVFARWTNDRDLLRR